MARLAGVELNDNWRVDYALTRIKGLGWASAAKLLTSVKIEGAKRVRDLSAGELSTLTAGMEDYVIEGDLVRKVKGDIARLHTIGSYRGVRHARGLPVRGQRTKSNARTKRGKKKTVGAFKKEALVKQQVTEKVKETKK